VKAWHLHVWRMSRKARLVARIALARAVRQARKGRTVGAVTGSCMALADTSRYDRVRNGQDEDSSPAMRANKESRCG
jgi:hypothetical protein